MLVSKPGKKDACNIKVRVRLERLSASLALSRATPHRKDSIALLVVSGCSQVFTMLTNGMDYF